MIWLLILILFFRIGLIIGVYYDAKNYDEEKKYFHFHILCMMLAFLIIGTGVNIYMIASILIGG